MPSYTKTSLLLLSLVGSSVALPVMRREVPQEHSHEDILRKTNTALKLDNPDGIVDAVFSLLGNAAASKGLGKIADPDCLQLAVADRAFTNAKAAGDIDLMTAALQFRALERNTGSVGQASVLCTSIQAVNPEIAALSQHQDPASAGAAATNKAIVLELAKQLHAIGADPQLAINTGTFAPGQIGDPTGAGNTCDDANDANGCINTLNRLVPDATADEINAAVGGAADDTAAAETTAEAATTTAAAEASTATEAAAGGALTFGTCTDPSVKFAPGLENRKATEFAFIPNNLVDFNHGSALNPAIIFQFVCDTLVNRCGFKNGDATVETCRSAGNTAAALGKVGAAADSFNKALGFNTDFAAVNTAVAAAPAATAAATPAQQNNNAAAASGGALSFGTCSDPSVKFGAGLDGRKATELSFIPNNLQDFNHGSALNPAIIFQFICDTLVNRCGFKNGDATVDTCRNAGNTAAALGKVGAAADSFNKALGFNTNFASVVAPAA